MNNSTALRLRSLSRLDWLMHLYAENYSKWQRLFDVRDSVPGSYRLEPPQAVPLQLDVLAQHRYTSELQLRYAISDTQTVCLRLYHDAKQLEVTGYDGAEERVASTAARQQALQRLRVNTFLGKWLDYLQQGGYGRCSLQPVQDAPFCQTSKNT